jgi:hypothetical protein
MPTAEMGEKDLVPQQYGCVCVRLGPRPPKVHTENAQRHAIDTTYAVKFSVGQYSGYVQQAAVDFRADLNLLPSPLWLPCGVRLVNSATLVDADVLVPPVGGSARSSSDSLDAVCGAEAACERDLVSENVGSVMLWASLRQERTRQA